VKEVLISETMRLNRYDSNEAVGVWEAEQQRIIVKRDQLQRQEWYAATLLHEYTHALSGADDETLEFEQGLTQALGVLASHSLYSHQNTHKAITTSGRKEPAMSEYKAITTATAIIAVVLQARSHEDQRDKR
jgi:hypothetical protein